MSQGTYDLIVIGSGPGGYTAAIRASQLGLKCAIIERDLLGGVCLNWGCIPTKALLRSAEVLGLLKDAKEYGLSCESVSFDLAKVVKRSRNVAGQLSKGVGFLMKKNRIDVVLGNGRLTGSPGQVEVRGDENTTLQAPKILIATGAAPKGIPGLEADGSRVITSREAMQVTKPPKSIVIVGGGAIGVEFAYYFSVFGVKVTLVEALPQLLPHEDSEIAALLQKSFKRRGIAVHTSTRFESIRKTKSSVTLLAKDDTGKEISIKAVFCLSAVGVGGNVTGLGLDETGVATDRGFVTVNEQYQTSVPGVWAIGDIIGAPLLAHAASHEGIAAVEGMSGMPVHRVEMSSVPSCTYCVPQVASVGLSEKAAADAGYDVAVGQFPFRASGKALAMGEREGLMKLVFEKQYRQLLGAQILGIEATELIAILGIAISHEATLDSLLATVCAHPTLAEGIAEAAGDAFGRALNM